METNTNRYPGICFICGNHVEAGAGLWSYGNTICGATVMIASKICCPNTANAELDKYAARAEQPITPRAPRRKFDDNGNCLKCGGTGEYWKSDFRGNFYNDGCWSCGATGKKVTA